MKLISIIIPTYNRPKTLLTALQSIKTERKELIEVIVCNDYSSIKNDSENKYVIEKIRNESGLEIVYMDNSRNKGVSGARNTGIFSCNGKWIIFLDDDDVFVVDYIDNVIDFINSAKSVDFIWSDIYLKVSDDKSKLIKKRFFINDDNELKNKVLTIGISFGVCIQKKCLIECEGFNESFLVGEDTDLILKLLTRNCIFKHINYFGIIKNENSLDMLSKNLSLYSQTNIVKRLLLGHFEYLKKDISLYCAIINRGNFIYLSEHKLIKNFFFNLKFILKHRNKLKVLKNVIWKF